MLCDTCNVMKAQEEFYRTKSRICKKCLNTKNKCFLCDGYFSLNNKSYHLINFHAPEKTRQICKTEQYLDTNTTCRKCNNALRREINYCPKCDKVLAKSSLSKHKKVCKNFIPKKCC